MSPSVYTWHNILYAVRNARDVFGEYNHVYHSESGECGWMKSKLLPILSGQHLKVQLCTLQHGATRVSVSSYPVYDDEGTFL
jgi:hypothetical protein